MASPLLNTSARRGSAFRRVVSAAAALSTAPSVAEGLAVRRAVSLPLSPFRRHLASGAQARPPKSPNGQKGGALHRVVSAAAAPSSGKELAVRRAVSLSSSPLRRLLSSGVQGSQSPKSLDEKVNLLNQTMKEVDVKVQRGYIVYTSVQKLVEERKPHNRLVQWLWQVGAVTFLVFVQQWRAQAEKEN